jgi:ATP-binding protein involved in chromosome partitioning
MPDTLTTRIAAALGRVVNPRTGRDVIAGGMVRDLSVLPDGRVRLSFLLGAQDPASLVREVRHAVERVDGVSEVRVDVKDPSQAAPAAPAAMPGHPEGERPSGQRKPLPVMQPERAQTSAPPRVAPPTPVAYPNLGRVVAISSGKGGVGKSTVATNLAVALARQGARVGLMDADIYGPNIPRMMGVSEPPPVRDERIIPLLAHGVKLMSLGFLVERDQPAIWRGPIVMKVITQFLRDVAWGELDYFLVDMPPGTGDAQLSLVQATQVHGAVIVTTPQEVAVGDSLRGAKMFQRVGVPVLGIVENMSYFACPHCGKPTPLFGSGGGARLAAELGVPLLGEIPLYPKVMSGGDEGAPIVDAEPDSPAARALAATATRVTEAIGAAALA